MPFMDRTCNITRIQMLDATDKNTFANVRDTLSRYAFRSIDDFPEDKSVGWVNIDDMLDTEWRVSPPQKGGYLTFAMRMDMRRIQPAVLKKELRKAIQKEEEENQKTGKKFISRQRKLELREQVSLRLKSRMVPTPKIIDVIVDDDQPLIYITTTTPKEVETFCELFTRSFGISVAPLDFFGVAYIAFAEKRHELDVLEDTPFGAGAANSSIMPGIILGRDFLSFLWFFSEKEGGAFTNAEGHGFSLDVLDSVAVTDATGTKISASIGHVWGDNFSEAKLGIAKGKKVCAAKLRLDAEPDVFTCKMDQTGALTSLRLPFVQTPEEGDDPDAVFLERMYLLDKFWKMLDTAYIQFLFARLDADYWKTAVARINLWLRGCIADDNLNITIQSQEHTEHIWRQWFDMRLQASERASEAREDVTIGHVGGPLSTISTEALQGFKENFEKEHPGVTVSISKSPLSQSQAEVSQ